MRAHELTLNDIKADLKPRNRVVRVSDFLTNEEKIRIKLHRQAKRAKKLRGFDDAAAYSAEVLARFGYEAWLRWKYWYQYPPDERITTAQMTSYLLAERARDKANVLALEGIIISAVAGANNPDKHGHAPKSLKNALNIFKNEQKLAKGLK